MGVREHLVLCFHIVLVSQFEKCQLSQKQACLTKWFECVFVSVIQCVVPSGGISGSFSWSARYSRSACELSCVSNSTLASSSSLISRRLISCVERVATRATCYVCRCACVCANRPGGFKSVDGDTQERRENGKAAVQIANAQQTL